jgi:hypothetical protein
MGTLNTANFEFNLNITLSRRACICITDFGLVKVCFSLILIEICDCQRHAYRFENFANGLIWSKVAEHSCLDGINFSRQDSRD